MADILAQLFGQFSMDEQAQIRAKVAAAKTGLVQGDSQITDRLGGAQSLEDRNWILEPKDEARAGAAGTEFAAYCNALWRTTDAVSQGSVREFLAQLERVCEGVLVKHGRWLWRVAIAEMRALSEQRAWQIHAQRLGIEKAEETTSTQAYPGHSTRTSNVCPQRNTMPDSAEAEQNSREGPTGADHAAEHQLGDPAGHGGNPPCGFAAEGIDPFAATHGERPLGDNPFSLDHWAYDNFEQATWQAKAEICRLQLEFLTPTAEPAELLGLIFEYRSRYFDVVASLATRIVADEETALWYEEWIDDSANFHLADTLSLANRAPLLSPQDLKNMERRFRLALKRLVSHYKAVVASIMVDIMQMQAMADVTAESKRMAALAAPSADAKPSPEVLITTSEDRGPKESASCPTGSETITVPQESLTQTSTAVAPRRRGFEANMDRHNSIAEIVSRYAPHWRENPASWRTDALKSICADLDGATSSDPSGLCEIPENWKTGKPGSLRGARVKGWGEALELAPGKLVIDQINSSLSMVIKKEVKEKRDHSIRSHPVE